MSPTHPVDPVTPGTTAFTRIGVTFPGDPANATTWSGTPAGVLSGLEDNGVEAVAISTQLASPLAREVALNLVATRYLRANRSVRGSIRRARQAARASPALGAVESWSASRAVPRAGSLDGIIQIGTGYVVPSAVPVVTFEDMTVPQVRTHPYPGWDLLSTRDFSARVDSQRRAYGQAVACCLTSNWAAQSVISDYGVDPGKVHVVGVGVNHEVPDAAERDWSEPRFLFIGMDWSRKNGDAVIRAFRDLHNQLPVARLDVVGGHPPLDEPGVKGHGVLRLDIPEHRARLRLLFSQATCFVMPSQVEAAGIAYVEAAAAGLPSIGTSAGGSDLLIGDGGLVIDPADDAALLKAMRYMSEPAVAARMGAAARERSHLFTWQAVARRLLVALSGAPFDHSAFS